jgi:hypothetical protein
MALLRHSNPVTVWKYYQPQTLSGKPEGGLSTAMIGGLTKIILCNRVPLRSEYQKLVILSFRGGCYLIRLFNMVFQLLGKDSATARCCFFFST